MSTTQSDLPTLRRPLRLWPGVVAAALVVLLRFVLPPVFPDLLMVGVIAAVAGAAIILLWWLFFSRAPWPERLGAVAAMIAAVFLIKPFLHASIATGMMGMMFFVYAVPAALGPAFVAWAVATRRSPDKLRYASMVATILLACSVWTLLRTDGITGGATAQLAWRWTPTAEERLLAQAGNDAIDPAGTPAALPPVLSAPEGPATPAPSQAERPIVAKGGEAPATVLSSRAAAPRDAALPGPPADADPPSAAPVNRVEWPGFRGGDRDGVVRGVKIETDWSKSAPVQLWRRPIGPGWSSFAVSGDLLYTQEQRGEEEIVACYRVSTGQPVWRHRDAARFWESNGGAGPRGTPTLSKGRIYAFGATGLLNVLDARTGARVWTRDVAADAAKNVPMWGFASSPLIVGDLVVVAAAGKLAAYDLASGKPRWFGPNGGGGYSSPQLSTIGGVAQILMLSGAGATGVAPADGTVLWEHAWPGTPIVQPAMTPDGDVLITSGDAMGGMGMRRIAITHGAGTAGWTAAERWTSNGLKPYFNDFVVHEGHAFGFDGRILSCIDLASGTRKWKGGRYGQGQLVLLPDQDVLLVLSEDGELALVGATADKFTELARAPAIEGKTWNHPVLAGDILLVRNDREMAAFRLSRATR